MAVFCFCISHRSGFDLFFLSFTYLLPPAILDNKTVFPETVPGINTWIIVGAGGGIVNMQIYHRFIHM